MAARRPAERPMPREGGVIRAGSRTVHYCRPGDLDDAHWPVCGAHARIRLHVKALGPLDYVCVNCAAADLDSRTDH